MMFPKKKATKWRGSKANLTTTSLSVVCNLDTSETNVDGLRVIPLESDNGLRCLQVIPDTSLETSATHHSDRDMEKFEENFC